MVPTLDNQRISESTCLNRGVLNSFLRKVWFTPVRGNLSTGGIVMLPRSGDRRRGMKVQEWVSIRTWQKSTKKWWSSWYGCSATKPELQTANSRRKICHPPLEKKWYGNLFINRGSRSPWIFVERVGSNYIIKSFEEKCTKHGRCRPLCISCTVLMTMVTEYTRWKYVHACNDLVGGKLTSPKKVTLEGKLTKSAHPGM